MRRRLQSPVWTIPCPDYQLPRSARGDFGGNMGRAGGSASEKYERLSARHRAGLRQRLIVNLSVAAVLGAAFWIYASTHGMSFGPWVAGMILFVGAAKDRRAVGGGAAGLAANAA